MSQQLSASRVASKSCPVCQQQVPAAFIESWREFKIWGCPKCALQFSDPLYYSAEMYSEGYGDPDSQLAKDTGFHMHVAWGAMLSQRKNVMPFVTPLESSALKWIRSNIPVGSVTLDIGCGCGRFMMSLRQFGYEPYGVDVAAPPIEMLKRAGLRVAQGSFDSVPPAWPAPKVVSCFEVLEHVPDPVGFLSSIRRRFPKTPLVLSVPLPVDERCHEIGGFVREADYPPNHLTRWTRESLRIAFQKAGYKASIHKIHVTGNEFPRRWELGLGIGRLLYALQGRKETGGKNGNGGAKSPEEPIGKADGNSLHAFMPGREIFFREVQRYTMYPYILWLRLKGKSGYSFLVVGE